jgi:hypothetical protein
LRATVRDHVDVDPDQFFALLTNVERLPEWNEHIHHVVTGGAEITPGSEWVVEMRAMGSKWSSRSRALEVDPVRRHFVHTSRTDDGNPSIATWTWDVHGSAASGSDVVVSYELEPKTFWRRMLLARVRQRQLPAELRASLRTAEQLLTPTAE